MLTWYQIGIYCGAIVWEEGSWVMDLTTGDRAELQRRIRDGEFY